MKIVAEFNSLEEMEQFCKSVVAPGLVNTFYAAEKAEDKLKAEKKKLEPAEAEPAKEAEEPVKEEPVKEEPVKEEPVKEEPVKEYTLEDVRAKLGALQKAGHRDEVKAMLRSVGAEKLPEVDPKDYAALMQKAGELDA